MACLGLCCRGEDRLEELLALFEVGRELYAAYLAVVLVVLPPGAGDVAADDALDIDAFRFADEHRAADHLAGELDGDARNIGRIDDLKEVIGHDIAGQLEPEGGELREDEALIGDADGEDDVEGGNAVGGDDEEVVAEVVDV